jgi:curved DNA-binding protein CbpA
VEITRTDLYECLGAPRNSSQKELKQAFRRMVRACHPDLNSDDPTAAERLRQTVAAYETLGDPKRRSQYDRIESLFGPGRRPRQEVVDEKLFLCSQMPHPSRSRLTSVRARKAQAGKPAVVCLLLACLVGVLVAWATTVSPVCWMAAPEEQGHWPETANGSVSTARYTPAAESWFVQNAQPVEPSRR